MKTWSSSLATALFFGCLLTLAPVDSTYTGGIFGAEPLCAQEDPIERCNGGWEERVRDAVEFCEGEAFCDVGCNAKGKVVSWECCCLEDEECCDPDEDEECEEGGGGTH
ncbi:MAG: hypothetical protein OXI29_00350 [bacterium]|nr:hypothetical protein [bacterium]MDE2679268.1 hypothetical protein [Gemmatimonadota bacterium]MYJ11737.1 hypothetical protein [Gemmatimonadota bacterium]